MATIMRARFPSFGNALAVFDGREWTCAEVGPLSKQLTTHVAEWRDNNKEYNPARAFAAGTYAVEKEGGKVVWYDKRLLKQRARQARSGRARAGPNGKRWTGGSGASG